NSRDVIEHASGLRGNVARNNLARFWVERNLAAAKKEPSAANRLRIGTNRPRGFACRNDFFHAADCSCKLPVHNEHDKAIAQKNSQDDPERSERAPQHAVDYTKWQVGSTTH